MPRPPILPPPTRHRTTPPRRRLLCRETRQGDARRWCVGRRGDPEARGGGAEAAKGVQELPDMSEARRCCCARGAELVEARGLRAPRAQLSLVLRHRELGDGSVQVVKGESRAAKIEKGLSKEDKAQKLALKHWLEAIDPRHRYSHNLHYYYDCSLLAPQQEQAAFLLPA